MHPVSNEIDEAYNFAFVCPFVKFFFQDFNWVNTPKSSFSMVLLQCFSLCRSDKVSFCDHILSVVHASVRPSVNNFLEIDPVVSDKKIFIVFYIDKQHLLNH